MTLPFQQYLYADNSRSHFCCIYCRVALQGILSKVSMLPSSLEAHPQGLLLKLTGSRPERTSNLKGTANPSPIGKIYAFVALLCRQPQLSLSIQEQIAHDFTTPVTASNRAIAKAAHRLQSLPVGEQAYSPNHQGPRRTAEWVQPAQQAYRTPPKDQNLTQTESHGAQGAENRHSRR